MILYNELNLFVKYLYITIYYLIFFELLIKIRYKFYDLVNLHFYVFQIERNNLYKLYKLLFIIKTSECTNFICVSTNKNRE